MWLPLPDSKNSCKEFLFFFFSWTQTICNGRRLTKKIEVSEYSETSIFYTLKGISRKAIRGRNRES